MVEHNLHLFVKSILCCWCEFLHQVYQLQEIEHLVRKQACHGLQSSWLCKLHSCLASCCKQNFSKWPVIMVALAKVSWRTICCYHWFAHVVCNAYKFQCRICQFHWQGISSIWSCPCLPGVCHWLRSASDEVKEFTWNCGIMLHIICERLWYCGMGCYGRIKLGAGTGVVISLGSSNGVDSTLGALGVSSISSNEVACKRLDLLCLQSLWKHWELVEQSCKGEFAFLIL